MKITTLIRSLLQPASLCAAMLASVACGADTQRGMPVQPPAQPISAEALGSDGADGTGPTSFAGLPLQESPATWQDAQAFAAAREACAQSRGVWDAALLSCTCAAGELFILGAGCGPVAPPRGGSGCEGPLTQMKGDAQADCARSLALENLLLNLDLSVYKPAEVKAVARGLDAVSPAQLAGITLPAADGNQQLTLSNRLPAILPGIADKWRDPDSFPGAIHTTSPWDPMAKSANQNKACVAALETYTADAKGVCGALARARNGLRAGSKVRWHLDVFGDEAGHQVLAGQARVAKRSVVYRAHVQQGLPLQRQIVVTSEDSGQLQVLLAPNGNPVASTWFGPQGGGRAAFTSAWAPVPRGLTPVS